MFSKGDPQLSMTLNCRVHCIFSFNDVKDPDPKSNKFICILFLFRKIIELSMLEMTSDGPINTEKHVMSTYACARS